MARRIGDTQTKFELYRRLGAAINDGTLTWDGDGPPI